jgi:AAA domain, putative AbiEii toxin, Type IV TA system
LKAIYLKDVRCFSEPRCVPIAPLTLLVGENSSGKSSFLALTRIAAEVRQGNLLPNFNSDPFFLGAYDQVAHFRGGRGGRAKSFEIGIDADIPDRPRRSNIPPNTMTASWRSEFAKRGSQPGISSLHFQCDRYELNIRYGKDNIESIRLRTPSIEETLPARALGRNFAYDTALDFRFLLFPLLRLEGKQFSQQVDEPIRKELQTLYELIRASTRDTQSRPYAIAPVRTKPVRTYNPIEDTPKSEGSHVPMLLAKTYFADRRQWDRIKISLDAFGHQSGMFEELSLRTLGKTDSDPFQIMIKIAGPASNLIDVGYGVSQVMPIIVDLLSGRQQQTYLLQQPEVHLHPRAQAQLGSFLCEFIKGTRSEVLVETHSDYILDRIRMEVREKKNLSHRDIVILFFERQGREVKIHPLTLDENGNLQRRPDSYRRFFMEEEQRALGF